VGLIGMGSRRFALALEAVWQALRVACHRRSGLPVRLGLGRVRLGRAVVVVGPTIIHGHADLQAPVVGDGRGHSVVDRHTKIVAVE
jgi:hypothetical protein